MPIDVGVGIAALNGALKTAQGLLAMNDEVKRNLAIVDLTRQLNQALDEQRALTDRVRELDAEIAQLKAFDAEATSYELKPIGPGAVGYMLKPDARGSEPPFWLCPNCFAQKTKAFLQRFGNRHPFGVYRCVRCSSQLEAASTGPTWG